VFKVPAAQLRVSDKEAREVADAWKPLLDHYKVNMGTGFLWGNAIGATVGVVGAKLQPILEARSAGKVTGPPADGTE
jgi:hypothetical protein